MHFIKKIEIITNSEKTNPIEGLYSFILLPYLFFFLILLFYFFITNLPWLWQAAKGLDAFCIWHNLYSKDLSQTDWFEMHLLNESY